MSSQTVVRTGWVGNAGIWHDMDTLCRVEQLKTWPPATFFFMNEVGSSTNKERGRPMLAHQHMAVNARCSLASRFTTHAPPLLLPCYFCCNLAGLKPLRPASTTMATLDSKLPCRSPGRCCEGEVCSLTAIDSYRRQHYTSPNAPH